MYEAVIRLRAMLAPRPTTKGGDKIARDCRRALKMYRVIDSNQEASGMSIIRSGLCVLLFTAATAGCAVEPGDPTSGASDPTQQSHAEHLRQVELGNALLDPTDERTTNSCLQLIEACAPGLNTCAVRCCDDALFLIPLNCGVCTGFANDVCATHGGPKRIRWQP